MPSFFNPKCIHTLCYAVTSHSASGFTMWLALSQWDIGQHAAKAGTWKVLKCLDFLIHILLDNHEKNMPRVALESPGRGWEPSEVVSNHPACQLRPSSADRSWPCTAKQAPWRFSELPQIHQQYTLIFVYHWSTVITYYIALFQ